MAALQKLRYKVVSFSSEDADYPANQLNTVSPSTRGWQSVRFCPYPQELGFELIGGKVQISQIQLLSHQSKISSKIEIFVGQGNSYRTANFRRLGYLSLDSNERSSFQARELKTVFIDHVGSFIKLLINENHINKQNIYNQVGIIAVSLMGIEDGPGSMMQQAGGPRGAASGFKGGPGAGGGGPANPYNDLSIDMNLDPQTANKLRQLSDAKSRAIETEDYMTAKQIKHVEQDLKSMGSRLAQLDMAKSDAVMAEDYDLAKEIKDESDKLRVEIEDKIMKISIPGVAAAKPPSRQLHHQQSPKFAPASPAEEKSGPASARTPMAEPMNPGDIDHSGRKVAKVESLHHEAFDDKIGAYDNDAAYENAEYADASFEAEDTDLSHLPVTERPIKPKANIYEDDLIGGIDDDPNNFRSGKQTSKPIEQFPEGQHPLEGVPGFQTMPSPEPLSAGKAREMADQGGINNLLGEYRTRCLFSKTWILREAALSKSLLMMITDFTQDPPGLGAHLSALSNIIKLGVEDKIQQVLFGAIALTDQVLKSLKSTKVPKATVVPLFDPIISQLIEKLADGNGRLRDGGRKGLDILAASPHVGPGAVAAHALKALPPKQKNAWRPITARLQLLTDLVRTYGVGGGTGLQAEGLLAFPKSNGAFAHSTAEVREDAKRLVVAIQRTAGTSAVESVLKLLRPKQLEEYHAAFADIEGKGQDGGISYTGASPRANSAGNKAAAAAGSKPASSSSSSAGGGGGNGDNTPHSPSRVDRHLQHHTHAPGGKVPTSAVKAAGQKIGGSNGDGGGGGSASGSGGADGGEEPQDFTSCMFCGVKDPAWNENDLDVHYWKDCPLLISCPSCAQIVEIAGLPEHLLDECDSKDSYVPCEVTGINTCSSSSSSSS